jgi:hypothetical protein
MHLIFTERLMLYFDGHRIPTEWQNDGVDDTTWRNLLGPFAGIWELCICRATLAWELSDALQLDEIELDPALLPRLLLLHAPGLDAVHEVNVFTPSVNALRVAGRPMAGAP